MNKPEAERMAETIRQLLTGKQLIFVGHYFPSRPPKVDQNVTLRRVYLSRDINENGQESNWRISVSYSKWATIGSTHWEIDPTDRAIHSQNVNLAGGTIHQSWHIAFENDAQWEREFNLFQQAQTATQAGEG
jgi:hypothetical protein